MTDAQVATTIKKQIGVWPLAEVGARTFLFDAQSLYFDCKPKSRIVRVKVALNGADLYDVTVLNKKTGAVLYEAENVYNDSLPTVVRNLAAHI